MVIYDCGEQTTRPGLQTGEITLSITHPTNFSAAGNLDRVIIRYRSGLGMTLAEWAPPLWRSRFTTSIFFELYSGL
jgi:hypothetical protein